MLASFTAGMEYPRGDVDHNGAVNIGDVTTLIDYLLTGTWTDDVPEEPQNETFTVNGVTFTMVTVEGGTFMMGATDEQVLDAAINEEPAHQVTLSDYALSQTEVTQELWQAVMGSNPSYFAGNLQNPVEQVSWNDCQTFINTLNQLTGKTFRLPTEAEWEFAARGGNKSHGYKYAGSNTLGDVAWYLNNIPSQEWGAEGCCPQPVATKTPNELGLYDMSGNVWEWCQDWFSYYEDEELTDPVGPSTGTDRVLRGGCWHTTASACRVSKRYGNMPSYREYMIGLRLAL